jgi:hypothetical protein
LTAAARRATLGQVGRADSTRTGQQYGKNLGVGITLRFRKCVAQFDLLKPTIGKQILQIEAGGWHCRKLRSA